MKIKNILSHLPLFETVFALLVVIMLVFIGVGLKQANDSKTFFAKFDAKEQPASSSNQKTSVATTQTPSTPVTAPTVPAPTKTTTPAATTKPKVTTPAIPIPTAADISKATSDANGVYLLLSGYGAQYNYYPGELDPQTLVDLGNTSGSGFNVGLFSLPAGLSLQYLPTPSGCTTAAQNCTNFTLNVVQGSNNSIVNSQSGFPLT